MDRVIIGDKVFNTLVAVTEKQQAYGLKNRSYPTPIMSFPYDDAKIRKFWMQDTFTPLDIIFCKSGKVIDIVPGHPLSLQHIGPDDPSDLVVEIPGIGTSKKLGIYIGSSIKLIYGLITLAEIFDRKISKIIR